jgi:hypothetical protein
MVIKAGGVDQVVEHLLIKREDLCKPLSLIPSTEKASNKKQLVTLNWAWWLKPVIQATWKAEIGRITV